MLHCIGGVGRTGFVVAGYLLNAYLPELRNYTFDGKIFSYNKCTDKIKEEVKSLYTTRWKEFSSIQCNSETEYAIEPSTIKAICYAKLVRDAHMVESPVQTLLVDAFYKI